LRDVSTSRPPGASALAIAASEARRAGRGPACVSELPTQNTASNARSPARSSSHLQTAARSVAPRRVASPSVRATIVALASEAVTSKPRSASPTAS